MTSFTLITFFFGKFITKCYKQRTLHELNNNYYKVWQKYYKVVLQIGQNLLKKVTRITNYGNY